MNTDDLSLAIENAALTNGYDSCGIISVDDMDGFKKYYQERLKKVPSSETFYKAAGDLTSIKKRFPWARSVIICTFNVGRYRFPKELQGKYSKSFFLSSYNQACSEIQEKRAVFESFLDRLGIRWDGGTRLGHGSIGPLRYAALAAGLGIIRRNNFFYTKDGSFIELVGYVIDRTCRLYHNPDVRPCIENCNLCRKNCPTHSLSEPYTMDPLKCISFYTTFGKGAVPPWLEDEDFREWVCGCDTCQDVCPFNRRHNWDEGIDYPGLDELVEHLQPDQLLAESDDYLREKIIPMTDNHLDPSDTDTLRTCAKRSIGNRINRALQSKLG